MDRKYRQRGYMSSDRERPEKSATKREMIGPRLPSMVGSQFLSRCGGCGAVLSTGFDPWGRCSQCGFELHSCKQCAHFDTSYRFECTQSVPERIENKNARNNCAFYAPRMTVERQTSTAPISRSDDPRKAFENLFKK